MKNTVNLVLATLAVPLVALALWVSAASNGSSGARSSMTIIAGAATGGGWDTTARSIQQVNRDNNIVNNTQVVNIPGAGGTIALTKLATMNGDASTLLITGGGMITAAEIAHSGTTIDDVTPIARLAEEYNVFAVPADSDIQTLQDVVDALKADPSSITIGGAAIGNSDHQLAVRSAIALGIDPADIKYIPFEGGGEALNALLAHTVDVGVGGMTDLQDQVEAGNLRVLAISSPERIDGLDYPTFREAGIDVVLRNWRGVVAPPGITPEEREELEAILTEVHDSPEWKEIAQRLQWFDAFLVGDELDAFVEEEQEAARELVKALNL